MSPADRERTRLELERSMRDNPQDIPALRLLADVEFDIRDIKELCICERPLELGDQFYCEFCAGERGAR